MNYSVLVSDFMNKNYYVSFVSYGSAINFIFAIYATEEKEYTIQDYLNAGHVTKEQPERTELINNDSHQIYHVLSSYIY